MATTKHNKGDAELSILTELTNRTTQPEAYYIAWKYARNLLPDGETLDTFEKLQEKFVIFKNRSEIGLEKTLYKEANQQAIKYLLKRMDKTRDFALLDKYYSLAMQGDDKALRAYMNLKSVVLSDGTSSDELTQIIQRAATSSGDDDAFEMKF